ncbi:hypothetical protein B0H65DRAFT_440063 [Neurospora tetraspora]|uniref:Uncharacterized protein n=1 Tax=Neurospora tetraspora TaxID=94610 RepID=A0AAE0MU55_9PEZI|nr:hypothetical protein B0H65DRAFT_440063 [Neurospora tetraspora]
MGKFLIIVTSRFHFWDPTLGCPWVSDSQSLPDRATEPIITPAVLALYSSIFRSELDLARTFLPKVQSITPKWPGTGTPCHEAAAASESCNAAIASFVVSLMTFPVLQRPIILRRHRGKD